MKVRKTRSEILLLCAVVGTAIGGGAYAASPQREAPLVWLFSQDARFVAIDLDEERIVDVGNLWYMGIQEVDSVIQWPSTQYLLLQTKSWKLQGISDPSPTEWEARGLAVLVRGADGGLVFNRLIAPPAGATLVAGRALVVNGRPRLFLGWRSGAGDRSFATTYDDRLNFLGRLDNFWVTPWSCLTEKDDLLTPQLGYPRKKFIWNLHNSSFSEKNYNEIDRWGFDDTTPLFVAENCTTVIWAAKGPPSPKGTLILYDVSRGIRISQFTADTYVTPRYLPKLGVCLAEGYELIPIAENSSRQQMLGKIDFHSRDGTSLGALDVPKSGSLQAISTDETIGFHLSPWLLTVIDLRERRIRFQVDIPFTEAKVGSFAASGSGS